MVVLLDLGTLWYPNEWTRIPVQRDLKTRYRTEGLDME